MNPTEKQFYLRAFRHRAIVLHLAADYRLDGSRNMSDRQSAQDVRDVQAVVEELRDNKTHLVVSGRHLGTHAVALGGARGRHDQLARLSQAMVEQGIAFVERGVARTRASDLSASIAAALDLRVRKLVVVDPRGGLQMNGGPRSFINAAGMGRLLRDSARTAPWTKAELVRLAAAVKAGIGSVNLTDAPGLAQELFTYEGAGTLITADDYCQVRRLAADDFDEAVALLARGEREGFLLQRSASERARLLLSGFGAWFEGGRLSGIAALETRGYERNRLGEIVGLYTITKFQGEGVGLRIVDELLTVANASKLRAVFACTSNDRAADFFERSGFAEVSASRVPAAKWKGRARSGKRARVFWRNL